MPTLTQESYIEIQKFLGIAQTGMWDLYTSAAVKNFQLRMNLPGTGVLDDITYNKILKFIPKQEINMEPKQEDFRGTTDLSEQLATKQVVIPPMVINYLPSNQYCTDKVIKYEYIFIHHTSGWHDPKKTVQDWASDSRGRIGVQYVIGGKSIKDDITEDGKIVKCIPDNYWAYHLGSTTADGINPYMHKNSIGIELCNFGYLTKKGSKFITYTGAEVIEHNVIDLGYEFRGYRYWHSYSDKQLASLEQLLKYLIVTYNITTNFGLPGMIRSNVDPKHLASNAYAFDYYPNATAGRVKGILSHTNVRKDKTDVYPHPKLIELLKSI